MKYHYKYMNKKSKKKHNKKNKKLIQYSTNPDQQYKKRDTGHCGSKDVRKTIHRFVKTAYQELQQKRLYFDNEAKHGMYGLYCYEHHSNHGNPELNVYHRDNKRLKNMRFWATDTEIRSIYDYYEEYGKIDYNQDWLEFFTADVISDLQTIMKFGSSNAKKAEIIIKEYKADGFYYVGEGTNILVMANDYYPGVVFKIALDPCGLADNTNDSILEYAIPRYSKVLARHPSSMVSVHERYFVMKQSLMKEHPEIREKILALLDEISNDYLIIDLCPDLFFLNYGIAPDGEIVFLDGSDLYPKDQLEKKVIDKDGNLYCQNTRGYDQKTNTIIVCGGKLKYTPNYSALVCKDCSAELNPLCLRPNKKEEGLDMYEYCQDQFGKRGRARMEQEELTAILEKRKHEEELVKKYATNSDAPVITSETPSISEENEKDEKETPRVILVDSDDEIDPEDDENEIEREDCQEISMKNDSADIDPTNLIDNFMEFESDPEEDVIEVPDTTDPEEEDSDADEDRLEFEVVNEDFGKDTESGIFLTVDGNFEDAWDLYGLSIYINTTDGYDLLVKSTELYKLLSSALEEYQRNNESDN